MGTIPAGTTQASATQAGTHELNISSRSKLWEIVQHGRSNKAPSLQHDRGSNRGNQTTVVAAARYMQQIHASNTPHKAAKQDSQTKVISTCYCYGALNKFAGSAVANADQLPKFDFWFVKRTSCVALQQHSCAQRSQHPRNRKQTNLARLTITCQEASLCNPVAARQPCSARVTTPSPSTVGTSSNSASPGRATANCA